MSEGAFNTLVLLGLLVLWGLGARGFAEVVFIMLLLGGLW